MRRWEGRGEVRGGGRGKRRGLSGVGDWEVRGKEEHRKDGRKCEGTQ